MSDDRDEYRLKLEGLELPTTKEALAALDGKVGYWRRLVELGALRGIEYAAEKLEKWANGYADTGNDYEAVAFTLAAGDLRRLAGLPEVNHVEEER